MHDTTADPGSQLLASLEREADVAHSPCGAGPMVWRAWGAGPPLVLLHGGYGAWTHWLRNIRPLASRYRVIAPDLPGLGDSGTPPAPYTPERLAAIIAEGFDAAIPGGARFHLVGFSFGALLGGHAAAMRGDQIRSFTLVGASALDLPRGPLTELHSVRRHMGADEVTALHRANLGLLMFADPGRIDDLAIHLQARNVARARVRSRQFARIDSLARILPSVAGRLQGIWGERDATAYPFVEERGRFLRSIQPGAPFHVIEGAGHWVQYEAADAFNGTLSSMLGA